MSCGLDPASWSGGRHAADKGAVDIHLTELQTEGLSVNLILKLECDSGELSPKERG
jgi:hypothetical protein